MRNLIKENLLLLIFLFVFQDCGGLFLKSGNGKAATKLVPIALLGVANSAKPTSGTIRIINPIAVLGEGQSVDLSIALDSGPSPGALKI